MSDSLHLPKSVQRVRLVSGAGDSVTVFRRSKKKQQAAMLKPFERVSRRAAEALKVGASEYLQRHESSNEDERNGWMMDFGNNVYRANIKAMKRARKGLPFAMRGDFED